MHIDWQTGITVAIGLAALAYLGRRWWPTWRGLWRPPTTRPTGCASGQGEIASPACGSGCGSCGAAGTPQRDHRITVQRSTAP